MPRNLVKAAELEHDRRRRSWMMTLSRTVQQLAERWSLTFGDPYQPGGQTAWVAPARTSTGENLVLKVAWRHAEAAHEANELRTWAGQGAVRLHATEVFDDTIALLIERCVPGATPGCRPEAEQDNVIASLLPRLWRQVAPGRLFRPLEEMCEAWADEFEVNLAAHSVQLDPGMTRQGIQLFRTLPAHRRAECIAVPPPSGNRGSSLIPSPTSATLPMTSSSTS